MTARNTMRACFIRLALALATAAGISGGARAQNAPSVIAPLQVAPDLNNVNLHDGRTRMEMPVLSVPAAPNLRFDRLQNAAPYLTGKRLTASGAEQVQRSYAIHVGAASSDAFDCVESECTSVTGTGSTFNPNLRVYTETGSGTVWSFGLQALFDTSATPSYNYYATAASYPDGEAINYYYNAVDAGLPFGRKMVRPYRITSSAGYLIKITYADNSDPLSSDWQRVTEAAIYHAADESTPLRRLAYSGATITEYGPGDTIGRAYTCQGCSSAMGADIQVGSGSMQLPGEGTPTLQVAATNGNGYSTVGSVTRDGVQWTYSYDNLRLQPGTLRYLFDRMTVTGPNGYNQVYDVANSYHSVHDLATNRVHTTVTRSTDSLGRRTSYFYDGYDRLYRIVFPELNEVSVAYDEYGNITSRTTTPKPGSGSPIIESAHFETSTCAPPTTTPLCWRPTWTRDALNRQTDYVYNGQGQLTEQIEPADQSGVRRRTSTIYDAASGISRRWEVRTCGDTGTTCPGHAPVHTAYDFWAPNLPATTLLPSSVRQVAPSGEMLTTSITYDGAGRLTSTDGPLAGNADATYVRYDVYGRKAWEIGAAAPSGVRVATRTTYRDADDRPLYSETGTLPDQNSTTLTVLTRTDLSYDGHRNAIRAAVSAGGTTQSVTDTSYDDRGQLVCTAVRMNPAAFGSAPGACALTATGSQGPDRITLNGYDAAGQLLQEVRAYGITTANGFPQTLQQNYATYTFSPNGRQTSVIDANGNRAEMTWDGFDRQRRWIFPSPTSPGTANQADYEEYVHDAVGNRISSRKRDGSTLTFQYDNLNRMTVKIVPERAGLDPSFTSDVYYAYDLRNAQTQATYDSLTGLGITNGYDSFGRLVWTATNMSGTSRMLTYQYDDGGRRTRITHPDGVNFNSYYDARSRMTLVTDAVSNWLDGFSYSDRGPVTEQSYGAIAGNSGYSYDAIDRLTYIGHNMGGAGSVGYIFGYNAANQIASRFRNNNAYSWTGAYNVSRTYGVNGLNQYTAAGGASFTYDANGNLTSDGATTYTYDVENRLVATSTGATLRYDPLGRLWTSSAPGFETYRYLYDGNALVGEYDASGNQLARYVHGADAGADDPLVWYGGSSVAYANARYLRRDHQGTIVSFTDASGTPLAINTYDEWGIPGASNQGRFQYTGQAWMGELGMYYYKARIYSPTLGRFLQVDPIGYEDQMNLYAYVGNDPLNQEDPSGECPWCLGALVGGGQELLWQTVVEGRSLRDVDWVDVGISAAAGATGVGIISGARRLITAERTIVRSERAIERARASAQRATGAARRVRAAAQIRRAQQARAASRETIRRVLAASAAAAAAERGLQEATPEPGQQPPENRNQTERATTRTVMEIDGSRITGERARGSRIGCPEGQTVC